MYSATIHESGELKQARPKGQDVDLLRSHARYSLMGSKRYYTIKSDLSTLISNSVISCQIVVYRAVWLRFVGRSYDCATHLKHFDMLVICNHYNYE